MSQAALCFSNSALVKLQIKWLKFKKNIPELVTRTNKAGHITAIRTKCFQVQRIYCAHNKNN